MQRTFHTYVPVGIPRARRLRRDATVPERLLWARLRRRALGVRFLRQHPIGPFIVDFYTPDARLAIEVDGRSHDGREAYDAARQAYLEARGVRVLRLTNDDVLRDPERSARRIYDALSPQPPP
jgi:very-short-patch-repair endonuclease